VAEVTRAHIGGRPHVGELCGGDHTEGTDGGEQVGLGGTQVVRPVLESDWLPLIRPRQPEAVFGKTYLECCCEVGLVVAPIVGTVFGRRLPASASPRRHLLCA
jgi:hypothetical protein